MNVYYDDGYRAYQKGKTPADNPYANCGCQFKEAEWREGWHAAEQASTENEGGKS